MQTFHVLRSCTPGTAAHSLHKLKTGGCDFSSSHKHESYMCVPALAKMRPPNPVMSCCKAHAGSDGTRRRTGGEVKGKDANGVGSQ